MVRTMKTLTSDITGKTGGGKNQEAEKTMNPQTWQEKAWHIGGRENSWETEGEIAYDEVWS